MDITSLSSDPLNSILEIMDFTNEESLPEFPLENGVDSMVNLCGAPRKAVDYVTVPTYPVKDEYDVNRDRRRVLVSAIIDIIQNNRTLSCKNVDAEYILETTEDNRLEVTLGNIAKKWKIMYNSKNGIGATPLQKEGDQWKCGTYISYNDLIVEPIY